MAFHIINRGCFHEKIQFDIDPYAFTGSAVLVGFLLSSEFTQEELDSIGNWLQVVGLVMQTYASQVTTINANQNSSEQDSSEIDQLKQQYESLEKQMQQIKDNLRKKY